MKGFNFNQVHVEVRGRRRVTYSTMRDAISALRYGLFLNKIEAAYDEADQELLEIAKAIFCVR